MDVAEIKDKIMVFLESEIAGIPAKFLVAGLVVILALAGVYLATAGPGTANIELAVKTSGQYLEGASISIYADGELIKQMTSGKGSLELELPAKEITVKVSREGCEPLEKTFTPAPGMILTFNLDCKLPELLGKECISFAKDIESAKIYVDNKPARNCKIMVKDENGNPVDLGWKIRSGYKILMSYDKENCPTKGYTVQIVCDKATAEMSMYNFLSDAKMYGKISLISNTERTEENTYRENLADKTYNIMVTVKDDKGVELPGIKVRAVDGLGNELDLGYSNVITSASTSFDGRTKLVLPAGQKFYIVAEDPDGNHPIAGPEGPYTASQPLSLSITMKTGFSSTITVLDNDTGEPLVGAWVYVYKGTDLKANGVTGADGKATINLEKGEYTLVVQRSMYLRAKETIQAGQDITVKIAKLSDKNSAEMKARVVSAHGFNEPLEGITVQVKDSDGTLVLTQKTDSEGYADLGRLPAGSYVLYVPATDNNLENDFSQPFTVVAGNPETVEIQIIPPQVKLKINTLVQGYPTQGVQIQVFDVKYNPLYPNQLYDLVSNPPGQLEISLDKGSVIYIKAMFNAPDGKVYGPFATQSFTVNEDMEISIDLSETVLNQSAYLYFPGSNWGCGSPISPVSLKAKKIPGKDMCLWGFTSGLPSTYSVKQGTDGYIILPVNLPYYDPQTKEVFDEVDVEVFVGELGVLSDTDNTPIVIKDITNLDILRGSQDVGSVQLLKSDAILDWSGPLYTVGDTDMHTAKYLAVKFANYKGGMQYVLQIPIKVRAGAKGLTHIYYRTTWIKGSAVYTSAPEGRWENLTVNISPAGEWLSTDDEQFYAYRAWISQDEEGKTAVNKLTDGSVAYLQIEAVARTDLNSWNIPLTFTLDNPGLEIEEAKAYVNEHEYYSVNYAGSTITGEQLEADDVVHVTLKMKVDANINLAEEYVAELNGEILLFNDTQNPIEYTVIPIPDWEQTPIPNLMYKEAIYSYFEDSGCWVKQDPSFISTYSGKLNKPRQIAIAYQFRNTGNEDKEIKLVLNDANNKDSVQYLVFEKYGITDENISLPDTTCTSAVGPSPPRGIRLQSPTVQSQTQQDFPENGEITLDVKSNSVVTVYVLAEGTPKLAYEPSEIRAYLGLASETSIKLWKTYRHGWLDYEFSLTDADTGGPVITGTVIGKVQILKKSYPDVNPEPVLPMWVEADNKVDNVKLSGDALRGGPVYAEARGGWDYFLANLAGKIQPGTLTLEAYSPIFGNLKEDIQIGGLLFDPLYASYEWNASEIKSTTILVTNVGNKSVTLGVNWVPTDPSAYHISVSYKVYDAYGNYLGQRNGLPAGGYAEITISGGGVSNCVGSTQYTLNISGTQDGKIISMQYYPFTFVCPGAGGVEVTVQPAIREKASLDMIDTSSCGITGDVIKLCDADQFVEYLTAIANKMYDEQAVGQQQTYYAALGNEELDVDTLDRIAQSLGSDWNIVIQGKEVKGEKNIVLPGYFDKVGCGIVNISAELTPQGNVLMSLVENSSVSWCDENSPNFFIGLMNLDQITRSKVSTNAVVFDGDTERFVNATLQAMQTTNLRTSDLYSYAGETSEEIIGALTSSSVGGVEVRYYEMNQVPANAPENSEHDLGNGFKYYYWIDTEYGRITANIWFIYPADLNLSDPEDAATMGQARVEMARQLLNYWFSGQLPTPQDTTPPTITVTSDTTITGGKGYKLRFESDEPLDTSLSYIEIGGTQLGVTPLRLPGNVYESDSIDITDNTTYTIHACDDAGNCRDYSGEITLITGGGEEQEISNDPVITNFNVQKANTYPPSNIYTVSATIKDHDSSTVNWYIYVDDKVVESDRLGLQQEDGYYTSTISINIPLDEGVHTVTLTVRDKDGNEDSESTTVEVTGSTTNSKPVARITYLPQESPDRWVIVLDGSDSYDEDGEILSYKWSASDGLLSSTNSKQATLTVPKNGRNFVQVEVTLEVTDNKGSTAFTSTTLKLVSTTQNECTYDYECQCPPNKVPKCVKGKCICQDAPISDCPGNPPSCPPNSTPCCINNKWSCCTSPGPKPTIQS